jgi:hypothetical protein
MRGPPSYFEAVRAQAARDWEQLKANPGLAGPWYQLFRQVDRFRLANDSLITKSADGSFPWEQRTRSGDLVRCYRPKEHCLEREPLQIESNVRILIEKFPDRYALI